MDSFQYISRMKDVVQSLKIPAQNLNILFNIVQGRRSLTINVLFYKQKS